jgi:hypothetical protein
MFTAYTAHSVEAFFVWLALLKKTWRYHHRETSAAVTAEFDKPTAASLVATQPSAVKPSFDALHDSCGLWIRSPRHGTRINNVLTATCKLEPKATGANIHSFSKGHSHGAILCSLRLTSLHRARPTPQTRTR